MMQAKHTTAQLHAASLMATRDALYLLLVFICDFVSAWLHHLLFVCFQTGVQWTCHHLMHTQSTFTKHDSLNLFLQLFCALPNTKRRTSSAGLLLVSCICLFALCIRLQLLLQPCLKTAELSTAVEGRLKVA